MSAAPDPAFEDLLVFLKSTRGFDFTGYKRASLMRRVQRRLQALGLESFEQYRDYLELHAEEYAELFNTILINVTRFFRDADAWQHLSAELVPLLEGKDPADPIRVWTAGCASGEEAYTVAMLLAEGLGPDRFRAQVKIYATDVDDEELDTARHGVYSATALEQVPEDLRIKYFDENGHGFAFRKDFRRCIIFGRHDLVQDAPISRVDLLTCRNTLMYFNAETQAKILSRFHFALAPEGILMLGKVEMLLGHSDTFEPIDHRRRLFRKAGAGSLRERLLLLTDAPVEIPLPHAHGRLAQAAFDVSAVASIVVDANGFLVGANQRARMLFDLTPNDIGRPFQDLTLSYRPIELRSWIDRAQADLTVVAAGEIEWSARSGRVVWLSVEVSPLADAAGTVDGVVITFADVTAARRLREELTQANRDLELAYEELQSTNEELETTNEELQSTVEELETTNEELQSTNEELETMNSELQATNEELQSINEELRRRDGELNDVNEFLEQMLSSMRGGVAVLDADLNVQMWNGGIEDLFGLREQDVRGRHFLSLDFGLPVDALAQSIRSAVQGAKSSEVVVDATNRIGRTIACGVTITPMVDTSDSVRGVMMVVEDQTSGSA